MLKVKLKDNKRVLDIEEANFHIKVGEVVELPEKYIKSYDIKDYLFTGILQVVEGEILFQYKIAKVYISAKYPNRAFGIEYGSIFYKDLTCDEIRFFSHVNEPIPKDVQDVLTGVSPIIVATTNTPTIKVAEATTKTVIPKQEIKITSTKKVK